MSGWGGGSPPSVHSRLLAPQFGQAGSFSAVLAAMLSHGVFAPGRPTIPTRPCNSFFSSHKRDDQGCAAHQWQS